MGWLTQSPAKLPPQPSDVDILAEMAEAERKPQSMALQYFREHAPVMTLDTWGQPLPYSRVDQDRANRIWALLVSPLHRGRALMRSGAILREEVGLLHEVYPDIYGLLSDELNHAMLASSPPFPVWADALVSAWFGLPPKAAFSQAQVQAKGGGKGPPKRSDDTSLPTAADRRELAVRER